MRRRVLIAAVFAVPLVALLFVRRDSMLHAQHRPPPAPTPTPTPTPSPTPTSTPKAS